jgi:hypothetical protein
MSRIQTGLRRIALGRAVTGSLGFGVSQAVAAPSAQGESRVCNSTNCPQRICECVSGQCLDRVGGFWCFS